MVSKELKSCIYAGFDETVNCALYKFGLYVQCVQTCIVKSFHASQNAFVSEKMLVRLGILNLSHVETPTALTEYLSDGIKHVPSDQLAIFGYHNIMQQDLRGHLVRVFINC